MIRRRRLSVCAVLGIDEGYELRLPLLGSPLDDQRQFYMQLQCNAQMIRKANSSNGKYEVIMSSEWNLNLLRASLTFAVGDALYFNH